MITSTTEELIESSEVHIKRKEFRTQKQEKRNLWRTIAKNEIRIKTSNFRNHRILLIIAL